MRAPNNAVTWYTEGIARFPVYFPEGEANCRHCEFCTYAEHFGTYRCRLTQEYLEKSQLSARGRLCPIEFPDTQF